MNNSSNDEFELLKSMGPYRIIVSDDSIEGIKHSGNVSVNEPIIIKEKEIDQEKVLIQPVNSDEIESSVSRISSTYKK